MRFVISIVRYDFSCSSSIRFSLKEESTSLWILLIVSSCDIDILWRKIDSHTGNKKNDLADKLAKEGVNR